MRMTIFFKHAVLSDGFFSRLNNGDRRRVFDCNGTYLYFKRNNELRCVNDLSPSPQGMTDSEVKNTLGSFDVSNFNIVFSISNRTALSRPSQ